MLFKVGLTSSEIKQKITISRARGILYLWLFSFSLHTVVASAPCVGDFVGARAWIFVVDCLSKRPCNHHVLTTVSKPKTFVDCLVLLKE